MPNIHIYCFVFLAVLALLFSNAYSDCLCTASQSSCWPDHRTWSAFNASVDGRLIRVLPPAAPCHDEHFDQQACSTARSEWASPFWRSDQPGAMEAPNWEASGQESCLISSSRNASCSQGSVPIYAVSALTTSHVQAAVKFASAKNLRLVIKNTGHDYLGRSAAAGSFSIWMHNMLSMRFHDIFVPRKCRATVKPVSAVTVGAGVQWDDLYRAVFERNKVIVGGVCPSVGAAGGYPQGGGHGALSPTFGLAADNILEYKVVRADGELITANSCQNRDLFWALRGGGGGTFGVVISVTYKTHRPLDNVVAAIYSINSTDESSRRDMLTKFASIHPSLSEAGWAGNFVLSSSTLFFAYLLPNQTESFAAQTLTPFLDYVEGHPGLVQTNGSLITLSSFEQWRLQVSCDGRNSCRNASNMGQQIGVPGVLSSRLIPTSLFYNTTSLEKLSHAMATIVERYPASITGMFAGGGAVSTTRVKNSVNPAWRRALWLLLIRSGWNEGAGLHEQREVARNVTAASKPLIDLTPGSGTYGNEADFNEPNWQQSLFGSNYRRLYAIKNRVDPSGLFRCHHCVGSEHWSDDLNCREFDICFERESQSTA